MQYRVPHEENLQVVYLVQALLGAISNNFRAVSLSFEGKKTHLHFVLELESKSDREEIEDIVCQFESYQSDDGDYKMGSDFVIVSRDFDVANSLPGRVVFRRKE